LYELVTLYEFERGNTAKLKTVTRNIATTILCGFMLTRNTQLIYKSFIHYSFILFTQSRTNTTAGVH